MTWLRIDDKFARHPKIAALTDREFRVWIRLLCYCAEYKTRGKLPTSALEEVNGLTNTTVTRFVTLGLLDQDKKSALTVHDWKVYNPNDPTAAERMRRLRSEQDRNDDRNCSEPRARARARGPVPSPLRGVRGEGLGGESPASPNGPATTSPSQVETLQAYVHRVWDDYPDKQVLYDELLDRAVDGATANRIMQAEQEAHT